MVGYPTEKAFMQSVDILVHAGAKILELGIPFSDPIADGPLLTTLNHEMITNGMTYVHALDLITKVKIRYPKLGICIMSYINPLYRMGYQSFFSYMQKNTIDAFLMPDVPLEEFDTLWFDPSYCDNVMIISDNLSDDTIARINKQTTWYLYVMSFIGTTGAKEKYKEAVQKQLSLFIQRVRTICWSDTKLVVWFGIKTAEDIAFLKTLPVDWYIIGSQIAQVLKEWGIEWLQMYLLTNIQSHQSLIAENQQIL